MQYAYWHISVHIGEFVSISRATCYWRHTERERERSDAVKCDREKLCNKKRKQVWWRKKIDSSSCYGKKSISWFIVVLLLNFDWSCWYSKCMCVCVFFNAWNFNIFILFLSRWHNVCLFNIANGGNIVGIPMWSQHKLKCTHRNVWKSMLNLHSLISS